MCCVSMCVSVNLDEKYTHTLVRHHIKAIAILAKGKEKKKMDFLKLLTRTKNNLPRSCLIHYLRKNSHCVSRMILEFIFTRCDLRRSLVKQKQTSRHGKRS